MRKDTERLLRAMTVLGELMEPRMTWLQGMAFLQVALADTRGEEMDLKKLGDRMNLPSSTITRLAQGLGEWDRMQKPGMKVVEERMDLADRRRRFITLSAKGKRVLSTALEEMKR